MCEVERVKAEGWRFLAFKPHEIEALTPREFNILMKAEHERRADMYEREAFIAIMHENASRSKRAKPTDLYKRPLDVEVAEKKTKELLDKSAHASEWLSQFPLFGGGGGKE